MKKFPSLTAFRKYRDEVEEIDQSIRSILTQQNLSHHSKESYPYIPYPEPNLLYEIFKKLTEGLKHHFHRKPVLLDVGAGSGRIIALAKFCGIDAKGIEFHPPYVELGRKFYGFSEEELIVENGFNLKFDFLRKFNVIYTYMPIRNRSRMSQLHQYLVSHAQYDTILLEMLPAYYPMNHFKLNKRMALGLEFTPEELNKMDFPYPAAITVQLGWQPWDEKELD